MANERVYCQWPEKEVGIPPLPGRTLHYTTKFSFSFKFINTTGNLKFGILIWLSKIID